MTNKRQHNEYSQRRELQNSNWRVKQRDSVAFNSGSETIRHYQTKCAAAWVLRERDYRIDSEVEMPNGEVDLLGYGREDGDIIVVECETSPTQEIVEKKLEQYYHNQPPRECYILNVNNCPENFIEAVEWVRGEL